MNEEIKAVADRLIGLREIMDVSIEQAAKVCGISEEQYKTYESGNVDIPVGILQSMSKEYGIDLGTLISGKEPHMHFDCAFHKFLSRRIFLTFYKHIAEITNGFYPARSGSQRFFKIFD